MFQLMRILLTWYLAGLMSLNCLRNGCMAQDSSLILVSTC